MIQVRDIILKLKEVRDERKYSINDILALVEKNGDYISKSTVARVFAEGSEEKGFRYELTIRPIAKALLDIENIEDDDSMDIKAMKSLLKYKIERIEELEQQVEHLKAELDKEKLKRHEAIDEERANFEKERARFNKSIDFLKEQVNLKDKRMDLLLNEVFKKQYDELLDAIRSCPLRK